MKKGQVWVETMIYTLIFLTLIGVLLAYAQPKINELKEKTTIEQSITLLEDIDNIILSIVQGGPGNRRLIDINLKQGEFIIDGEEDKIVFEMDTTYDFSEPGKEVDIGRIKAITTDKGKINKVKLIKDYNQYNITYNGKDVKESITSSPNPYKMYISNKGSNGQTNIDIQVE